MPSVPSRVPVPCHRVPRHVAVHDTPVTRRVSLARTSWHRTGKARHGGHHHGGTLQLRPHPRPHLVPYVLPGLRSCPGVVGGGGRAGGEELAVAGSSLA